MRNLIVILAAAMAACSGPNRETDAKSIIATNCASCHVVPGVPGANGNVGPPLAGIGNRQVIAGYFANNRQNMVRWITHAQSMLPNNAMPDTNLTPDQADEVAQYLSTLR
jgi:cytochrome c1